MKKLTAVIITGNPKFIKDNAFASKFYDEIRVYLENLGFEVTFDPGEEYTSPIPADLWIGHSRGVDRLRFPKENVKTLAFGSSTDGAINHPMDNTKDLKGESDLVPNEYHYIFTEEMREEIKKIHDELVIQG